MLIIGITGPTGAGKSSVCEFIKNNYNAEIIDADKVVKELQNDKQSSYYLAIREIFGSDVLDNNDFINRKTLAHIAFADINKKDKLNELTKRYVVSDIKERIQILRQTGLDYIIVDAPTLIENGMQSMFDKIIAVIAKKEDRLKRICKRDDISEEYATLRMQAQKGNEFYTKYADFVITNEDKDLESKVRTVFKEMGR